MRSASGDLPSVSLPVPWSCDDGDRWPVTADRRTRRWYGGAVDPARAGRSPMLPVLSIGPFTVATHDAFSLIALAVGLALYYVALRRQGLLEPTIVTISAAAVVGGVLGARLITSWE